MANIPMLEPALQTPMRCCCTDICFIGFEFRDSDKLLTMSMQRHGIRTDVKHNVSPAQLHPMSEIALLLENFFVQKSQVLFADVLHREAIGQH